MSGWTTDKDMPKMDGKTVVVTGANSGIGFAAAKAFAAANAKVIFACRTESKAIAAIDRVKESVSDADAEFLQLDLSDLSSVEKFAKNFVGQYDGLDVLVNNAGIMVPPYSKTKDGFESQMGTNHFGHFALTGRLLETLSTTPNSRVVNVASMAHKFGTVNLDDLDWETRRYKPWPAYGQSKLANLLFTYELDRRLKAAGKDIIATAAHPGYTATDLQKNMSTGKIGNKLFAQSADAGAWPTLAAATLELKGGEYYGPGGFMELSGPAKLVPSNAKSHETATAAGLWEVSQARTGVTFDL